MYNVPFIPYRITKNNVKNREIGRIHLIFEKISRGGRALEKFWGEIQAENMGLGEEYQVVWNYIHPLNKTQLRS